MSIIYTVGHTESYRHVLAHPEQNGFGNGPVMKLGPFVDPELEEPYRGGIAFETVTDAVVWLAANDHAHDWSCYSLSGNWTDDVYWDEESGFHRINRDLKILEEMHMHK